jgi:hypothetical protein
MNKTDLFYLVKPFIPRNLQLTIRRQVALRKLKSVGQVWPINPESGKPPLGWKGWPDGKQFALVLTHDVESRKGVERCGQLAKLEKDLGLRSGFYFVAEDYQIDDGIPHYLKTNGFEVGVHGLNHDRSLYKSEDAFRTRAPRINGYLKEWGAVGFRSPCMFRNLDWIGYLDLEYDMSTFDTDPFEPQPDGVGTIFPFIVYRNSVQGPGFKVQDFNSTDPTNSRNTINSTDSKNFFIELPYTLPQDHLLFIVLRERDIGTWRRKIDWIAGKGGMALLNTHPDYMTPSARNGCKEEYPISFYIEFLNYISNRYKGEYWHGLPRETAAVWRAMIGKS